MPRKKRDPLISELQNAFRQVTGAPDPQIRQTFQPVNIPSTTKETPKNQSQVFTDPKTGRTSGFSTADGRTFLGLKEGEANQALAGITNRELAIQQSPINLLSQQAQGAKLAGQVGDTQSLPLQQQNSLQSLDIPQTLGAGLASTLPGVVQGAIAGSLAGGVAVGAATGGTGAPIGAAGGAILGGVGGFLSGVRSNAAQQFGEDITSNKLQLTKSAARLRSLIQLTNANPQNAATYLQQFNEQLAVIDQSHQRLKFESGRGLNRALGKDATVELTQYELFNQFGGQREILIGQMQAALLNPNPAAIGISNEDVAELQEDFQ